MTELILSALLLGLLGAGHCLGMCGGFAAALSYAIAPEQRCQRVYLLLAYNVGRISSYALLGALVAAGQNAIPDSGLPLARTFAGLLLIATAFYLANIWRGITVLERAGHFFWRYLQPYSQKLLPVRSIPNALLLGAIWGWLPCGLVYSVLTLAATQESAWQGAIAMAAFGIGTFWAVMAGGLAADWVRTGLAKWWVKWSLALAFGVFGVWTAAVPWYHLNHHAHHHNGHDSINHESMHHGQDNGAHIPQTHAPESHGFSSSGSSAPHRVDQNHHHH